MLLDPKRILNAGALAWMAVGCAAAAPAPLALVASSPVPQSSSAQQSSNEPQDEGTVEAESSSADEKTPVSFDTSKYQRADWGIGAIVRTADIPFEGANSTVSSFVPMLFYEGDVVFLRGLTWGAHLWKGGGEDQRETEVNAITRMRFFDIPAEIQNTVQGDTADVGLQLVHHFEDDIRVEGEWMTDDEGRQHMNGRMSGYYRKGRLDLVPSLTLTFKTARFNNRYFALRPVTDERAGAGWELRPNVIARYHVASDFYLLGSLGYRFLDQNTRDVSAVEDAGQFEASLGVAFFQHHSEPRFLGFPNTARAEDDGRDILLSPYVRLAQGFGSTSSLADILSGNNERDPEGNQFTSLFYGHPLTDRLFGLPLDIFLTPGFVWHYESDVQDAAQEYVLAIKMYYEIPLPFRLRLGAAEGLSWISKVTHVERMNIEAKGLRPSQLNNFLDFSLDLNLGSVFRSEPLKRLWLGYSIHHRSSIFESASQFGRIKGGSNYNTVYLQYDLF